MIRMRKEVPEIGWGDFAFLRAGTPEVLAMRYPWRNNSVLCVHNFCGEPREVRLGLDAEVAGCELVNLLSERPQQGGCGWAAPGAVGALWVSVVPGMRAGLPSEAQHGVAGYQYWP